MRVRDVPGAAAVIARRRAIAAALAASLASCDRPASIADESTLVVRAPAQAELALEALEWSPPAAARVVRAGRDVTLAVRPDLAREGIVLRAPGACARVVPRAELGAVITLTPAFAPSGGDLAQLGYGAPFEIRLEPGCDEARGARVTWRATTPGAPPLELSEDGRVARGRLPGEREAGLQPPAWGLVPISPRSRGELTLEASWVAGGVAGRALVRVAAATRASGLPSVAVGQRLLLAGGEWTLREPPPGGAARPTPAGSLTALVPDARGRWRLEDAGGRGLSIVVGRHAETPLDCGRSDCHRAIAEAAATTRMTTTFHELLGRLRPAEGPCVLGCHTVGEPGLADGGFAHVLRELGAPARFETGAEAWSALPRPLRRLGGVGCTACHGPGAIPEPSAAWAILRADVCAVCHDAPPRYTHVAGWARSRMATADRDPARRASECRGCHGTAGYLARLSGAPERALPEGVTTGIACAACHSPHGAHSGELVRAVPIVAGAPDIPDAASRLCASCHSEPAAGPPRASAATLVYGAAEGATAPHAAIPGGCLGCHGDGAAPTAAARGHGHSFAVDRARCTERCHAAGAPRDDDTLATRARALYVALGGEPGRAGAPPHASPVAPGAARSRAREAALLVLEDPAAWAHNAPYARALLEEASRR